MCFHHSWLVYWTLIFARPRISVNYNIGTSTKSGLLPGGRELSAASPGALMKNLEGETEEMETFSMDHELHKTGRVRIA
jgi:hypothetical protein